MAYTGGNSPNAVKTALDDITVPAYNTGDYPHIATAQTEEVFRQDTASNGAVIWEGIKSGGLWGTRTEEQDVPNANPRVMDQKTYSIQNYAQSIDISKNFFDDNMHGAYEKAVEGFGEDARASRDYHAFGLYRNAFGTTTAHDGVALISNSHTNFNGDTVDNLLTGDLSETTLNTAITQMFELKRENGIIGGKVAQCLMVSPADFKLAVEITESELRSATPDNDLNVYSAKFGIVVKTSPYLGAVAGGDDDAWFVISRTHGAYRWTRAGLETTLVPWQYQRNNNYIYKGEFRETTGVYFYDGHVGSQGA